MGKLSTHSVGDATSLQIQRLADFETNVATQLPDAINAADFSDGIDLAATNPSISGDATNRYGYRFQTIYDKSVLGISTPNFSNISGLAVDLVSRAGQNIYNAKTQAKKTMIALPVTHTAYGAGQRAIITKTGTFYGMGDVFGEGTQITFASADVSGDEGQGYTAIGLLTQQASLFRPTILSITTPSTLDTTSTQAITASATAQAVTVASTTGAVVGDYVVVGQELPTGSPNIEVVQITAVNPGVSITARFTSNHSSGVTIKPALVMTLSSGEKLGEQRVLVNIDAGAASYTTGSIASISGAGVTGSGTTWAVDMVGGDALNIGAIAFDADDYDGAPFDGTGNQGPLKSWYQIKLFTSSTSIALFSYSTAGDSAYHGVATSGGYTIRPCARILALLDNNGKVACEYSTATWTVGDQLELAIPPYPDVHGHHYNFAVYTPGGALRSGYTMRNVGARMFENGVLVDGVLETGGNAAANGWGTAFSASAGAKAQVGLGIQYASSKAISLRSQAGAGVPDTSGRIDWNDGCYLTPVNADGGLSAQLTTGGTGGLLRARSSGVIGDGSARLDWTGSFYADRYVRVGSFTVSGVPSASSAGAGALIWVTNEAGGAVLAMSDGTNWRRVTDRATIS